LTDLIFACGWYGMEVFHYYCKLVYFLFVKSMPMHKLKEYKNTNKNLVQVLSKVGHMSYLIERVLMW